MPPGSASRPIDESFAKFGTTMRLWSGQRFAGLCNCHDQARQLHAFADAVDGAGWADLDHALANRANNAVVQERRALDGGGEPTEAPLIVAARKARLRP